MKRHARIIRLEAGAKDGIRRFLSDKVELAEGKRTSVVTVTRTGTFHDPRYGEFSITREMLLSMVRNFDSRVYGQDIALDVAHMPKDGAAAYFRRLFLDGDKLRAEVEWTDFGIDAVRKRGFKYLSAEYHENFKDNEKQLAHGPTLLGAGLTIRPVVKDLDPVQLSDDSLFPEIPTLISDRLKRILSEEKAMNWAQILAAFLAKLVPLKLAEPITKQLSEAFEKAAKPIADEKIQLAIMQHFVDAGGEIAKALGESGKDKVIKLDFSGLEAALKVAGKTLSEDDVRRVLQETETKRQADAKKLDESKAAKVKIFTDAIGAAESLKSLSESTVKELGAAAELITADMSDEQVRKLAENQIKLGSSIATQARLASMGFVPAGTVRITLDESNKIKALQEDVDKRLGFSKMPEADRFKSTGGKLQTVNKEFAEKILAEFDSRYAAQLHAEHKMLAAGDGKVSDVAVPAIFERTVIREALYSLVGLQFVNADSIQFSSSALIPYSYRDVAAATRGNTRRYEGQSILRAGVIQTSDTAYPIPQKLAFEVSDELRYLTAAGILSWDAVIENTRNASRIIGEDTEQLIFNEVLQASDEVAVTAVVNEALTGVQGTNKIFALVNFPIARPRKFFDLQGNQIGATINPITVTYAAVVRNEYDGTGTQAAGTYYVLDYNIGEIRFVSELGAPIVPPNATAITVSYSYTTNIYKFDTDLGALKVSEKWDDFLYRYSLRKNVIEQDRFFSANFGLMSGSVMSQVEQASQFGANNKRNGTDLTTDGNLGIVKGVPNFRTTAPGLNMADQRIVIGERSQTRFRMMKPWAMGQLENQKDANGRFTGKKEAYGDQFIVLHTPTPLKKAYTSIVLFSTTGRVNRVN